MILKNFIELVALVSTMLKPYRMLLQGGGGGVVWETYHISYWRREGIIRACLHGGGGPQVGEVTRLAVVENMATLHLHSIEMQTDRHFYMPNPGTPGS